MSLNGFNAGARFQVLWALQDLNDTHNLFRQNHNLTDYNEAYEIPIFVGQKWVNIGKCIVQLRVKPADHSLFNEKQAFFLLTKLFIYLMIH